jgi:putative transposase
MPAKFDPQKHHRRSIRLQGYDYTQPGAYFVTIVTQGRVPLFGEIVNGEMQLNSTGRLVHTEWQRQAHRFPNLQLDAFVVMPNHIHAILVIAESVRATHPSSPRTSSAHEPLPDDVWNTIDGSPLPAGSPLPHPNDTQHTPNAPFSLSHPNGPPPDSLGAFIGQFKSRITKRLRLTVPVWQRNYYEHIIRDDAEWDQIRQYILDNPLRWADDREHP